MKRTDAIQALRERFTNTDGTVLPPGLSIISKEEADALGVFDDFEWKKTEIQSADPGTGMYGGMDDGWIDWGGGDEPPVSGKTVSVRFRDGAEYTDASPETWGWIHDGEVDDIIAYKIHREG